MDVVSRTLSWQRGTLLAVLVLSAVVFWRGTFDVFNTVKATVIAIGAIAIVLWSVQRACHLRRVAIPCGAAVTPLWWAAGLFASGLVVATWASDTPWRSVVGLPGRHTGLAMYLVYLMLFAATVRLYTQVSPAPIATAVLAASVPVAGYGLFQAAGIDPFGWKTVEGGPPVFSTFGNANFFSAYLGVVVPLGVWGAVNRAWSWGWRAASVVIGLAAFTGAVVSTSTQGPVVAVLGTLVVVAVALPPRGRAALAAAGTGAAVALAAGAGPIASLRDAITGSLATRLPKWEIALAMARDRPLLGFGLDTYGDWFFAYRAPALAAASGLERSVDNPHNVLLHMLTGGGVVLAAGWLAFVGATAYALVHGLRRLQGEERLLLGGLGGAWVAYQAQALVSIDVPPLAVLHTVLAGAIVALGAVPTLREWALPGVATPEPSPVTALVGTGLALAGVGPVWAGRVPLRADRVAQEALFAAARGQAQQATTWFEQASALAFWESRYAALEGTWLARADRPDQALEAQLVAARRDPRGLAHALNVARLYARTRDGQKAAEWYDRVLAIDPHTPDVLAEVDRFRRSQGA